jgi:hypothetical protein
MKQTIVSGGYMVVVAAVARKLAENPDATQRFFRSY